MNTSCQEIYRVIALISNLTRKRAFIVIFKLLIFLAIGRSINSPVYASTDPPPFCISLGATCRAAMCLRGLEWRVEAYPFDWITSPFDALYRALDEDFLHFLTDLKLSPSHHGVYDHYGFLFSHDWPTTQHTNLEDEFLHGIHILPNWEESAFLVKQKYLRRIERLKQACLIKEKKVLFIRTEYVTKEESIALKNLIQSKWPDLNFTLVVIANKPEFLIDWNIEKIKNFYFDTSIDNPEYIKNILLEAAKED